MSKYLNLGCGSHFSTNSKWTNLDFESTGEGVIGYNLLRGIPFSNSFFDFVYHSHVLEHFSKEDGEKLIGECFRVLKPGGVLRIAIPDLERIVREYIHQFELGIENPDDMAIRANYDWILLEMYDQTVRHKSGGEMEKYFYQETILNEDFVFERVGEEGREMRKLYLNSRKSINEKILSPSNSGPLRKLKNMVRKYLLRVLKIDDTAYQLGSFRLGGQIHQWMYDKYSLGNLLRKHGGRDFIVRDAFTSYIDDWEAYSLDGRRPVTRKPDSLFIEVLKG